MILLHSRLGGRMDLLSLGIAMGEAHNSEHRLYPGSLNLSIIRPEQDRQKLGIIARMLSDSVERTITVNPTINRRGTPPA